MGKSDSLKYLALASLAVGVPYALWGGTAAAAPVATGVTTGTSGAVGVTPAAQGLTGLEVAANPAVNAATQQAAVRGTSDVVLNTALAEGTKAGGVTLGDAALATSAATGLAGALSVEAVPGYAGRAYTPVPGNGQNYTGGSDWFPGAPTRLPGEGLVGLRGLGHGEIATHHILSGRTFEQLDLLKALFALMLAQETHSVAAA